MNQRKIFTSLRPGAATALWGAGFLLLGVLRLFSFPDFLYSPDISFHAGKILRASAGELFIDPVSGTPTVYPALFHTLWGQIKSLSGLDMLRVLQWIGTVSLAGLFLGFFFMVRTVIRNQWLAGIATLTLVLVFYAPTGRYVLLQNPANFSFVILFFSLGFFSRYLSSDRWFDLYVGGFLAGLAVNFWWFHVIPVAAFFLVFFLILWGEKRLGWQLVVPFFLFLVPFLFTLVHWLQIGNVLANYRAGASAAGFEFSMIRTWLGGIISKGNFQFSDWLMPFSFPFFHFYFFVLPFSGILLVASVVTAGKVWIKDKKILKREFLWSHTAWLIFLSSLAALFVGNFTHLRRVQFIGFALLIVSMFRAWDEVKVTGQGKKILLSALSAASLISFLYLFSATKLDPHPVPPGSQREVIRFIRSLPDHAEMRIFVDEKGIRRLMPFVRFKGFISYTHGGYFSQDPVNADRLYRSYLAVVNRESRWRRILDAWGVRYLIFFLQGDQATRDVAEYYKEKCDILSATPDWLILER